MLNMSCWINEVLKILFDHICKSPKMDRWTQWIVFPNIFLHNCILLHSFICWVLQLFRKSVHTIHLSISHKIYSKNYCKNKEYLWVISQKKKDGRFLVSGRKMVRKYGHLEKWVSIVSIMAFHLHQLPAFYL